MDGDVEMRDDPLDLSEEWILIKSGDGFTFLVKGKVASVSGTLKDNLQSGLGESSSKFCDVQDRGAVVEKLLEYLAHKSLYEKHTGKEDIPDFIERLVPEIALELLMAADYYEA